MKKIFTKFSLGYLIVVTLLSTLIVYFSYSTIKSHYIDASAKELYLYSELLETELTKYNIENDKEPINRIILNYSDKINIRITIIKFDGVDI